MKYLNYLKTIVWSSALAMLLVLVFAQLTPSQAAVPSTITYQAKLRDSGGSQVSNDDWNFKFEIYDASSGGNLLWTERWTSTSTQISTVNGIFSVALGSLSQDHNGDSVIDSDDALTALDWNSGTLYLQIDLDADTNGSWEESFSSRKAFTSASYAFNTDTVDGLQATSTAAVANYLLALNSDGNLDLYDKGVSSTRSTTSYAYIGERLGVGLQGPTRAVDVSGGLAVYDDGGEGINLITNSFGLSNANNEDQVITYSYNSGNEYINFLTGGSEVARFFNGAFGVGTTTPGGYFGEKLTVSGNSYFEGNATTTGDFTVATTTLVIDNDTNNVGIGTRPNALNRLSVTGNTALTSDKLLLVSQSTEDQALLYTYNGGDEHFHVSTDGSGSNFLSLNSEGFVGIGVYDANYKLHVGNGDTFLGGNATTTGNLNIAGYASTTNIVLGGDGTNLGTYQDLYVSNSELYFDGTQITGTGGIGLGSPGAWQYNGFALTPTSSSAGIFVNASSTINGDFRVSGNATTTGSLHVGNASLRLEDGSIYQSTGNLVVSTASGLVSIANDLNISGNATTTGSLYVTSDFRTAGSNLFEQPVIIDETNDGLQVGLAGERMSITSGGALFCLEDSAGQCRFTYTYGSSTITLNATNLDLSAVTGDLDISANTTFEKAVLDHAITVSNTGGAPATAHRASIDFNLYDYDTTSQAQFGEIEVVRNTANDDDASFMHFGVRDNTNTVNQILTLNGFTQAIGVGTSTPGGTFGEKLTIVGDSYVSGNATTTGTVTANEVRITNGVDYMGINYFGLTYGAFQSDTQLLSIEEARLYDTSGNSSVAFSDRTLNDSSGATVFNWETSTFLGNATTTGKLVVSGTPTIDNIDLYVGGDSYLAGNATTTGNLTVSGDLIIGDNATRIISEGSTFTINPFPQSVANATLLEADSNYEFIKFGDVDGFDVGTHLLIDAASGYFTFNSGSIYQPSGDLDFTANSDGFNFTLGGGAGDDFRVDSTTLVVESDTNRVGIGTATPSHTFEVSGDSYVSGNATTTGSQHVGGDLWIGGTPGDYPTGEYNFALRSNQATLDIRATSSNPVILEEVGSLAIGAQATGVDVKVYGNYAVISSRDSNRISIIDISDPTSPTLISTLNDALFEDAHQIDVIGSHAYIATETPARFIVVDFSDPTNPFISDSITDGTNLPNARNVKVVGGYAYVTTDGGDFTIIDVSDPGDIAVVGNIDGYTNLRETDISGDYAYVTNPVGDTVYVFNIQDPQNPYEIGSVTDSTALNGAKGIQVSGSYAYVGAYENAGIAILDISDPTNPSVVSSLTDATYLSFPWDINYANDYLYVSAADSVGVDDDEGLVMIDVTDRSNPKIVGYTVNYSGVDPLSFDIKGRYAYIANFNGTKDVVVVSLPGISAPNVSTGNFAAGTIEVNDELKVGDSLSVGAGLTVQGNTSFYNGTLKVTTSTATILHVDPVNQRVGIGLDNPSYSLDVLGITTNTASTAYGSRILHEWNGAGGASANAFALQVAGSDFPTTASSWGGINVTGQPDGTVDTIYGIKVGVDAETSTTETVYGGYFVAGFGNTAIGVYASADDTSSGYAFYGAAGDNYFQGDVGVGTLTPDAPIHIALDDSSLPAISSATGLLVANTSATSDSSAISIITGVSGYASVNFGDPGDEDIGEIEYWNAGNVMFVSVGADRIMELESNGNVSIDDDLYIGDDNGSDDDYLYFDAGTEYLRWYNASTRFEFSDDIYTALTISSGGNLAVGGTIQMTNWGLSFGSPEDVCKDTVSNTFIQCPSSIRFKENVLDYSGSLDVINQLRPVTFDWKGTGDHDVGFIAEEVEQVDPLFTVYNPDGQVQGVKYKQLTALLVNAVQDQQIQIETLQDSIGGTTSSSPSYLEVIDNPDADYPTLVVQEAATFYGTMYVVGEAGFEHKVTFYDDVEINGKLYLSTDQAGTLTIPANATSTEVVFAGEFASVPKITVTPLGSLQGRDFWIAPKDTNGFALNISESLNTALSFDWIAIPLASDSDTPTIGEPPVIEFFAPLPDSVSQGDTVELQVTASDPDTITAALNYHWSIEPSNITSFPDINNKRITWDVGSISQSTTATITVTVTDGVNEVSQSKTITLFDDTGEQPQQPDPILGCTDETAENYNTDATQDDGSCTYPEQPATPTSTPPVEQPDPILGCTDETAENYNTDATQDDGSCTYPEQPATPTSTPPVEQPDPILGCTDETAENYTADATQDDGSCTYPEQPATPTSTPPTT